MVLGLVLTHGNASMDKPEQMMGMLKKQMQRSLEVKRYSQEEGLHIATRDSTNIEQLSHAGDSDVGHETKGVP